MTKKIYFLLLFVLACWFELDAQIVNIPDVTFKNKLISLIDNNHDLEIQYSEAATVTQLNLYGLVIHDLTGIAAFVNLTSLSCSNSALTSLDISMLPNLINVVCNNNQITTLQLNPNIESLICDHNQLTSLDESALTNVTWLNCSYNPITSLDVSTWTNLQYLYCDFTDITSLDASNLPNLLQVRCNYSQLTTMNVNNCTQLCTLQCNNNQLINLFIKNGRNEVVYFSYNPTLQYICADASEVPYFQSYLSTQTGLNNTPVSSFCSYTPGGNYNTVSGKSIYDADINGCTLMDSVCSFLTIEVTNGIDTGYICTSNTGDYVIYLDSGIYSFIPHFENFSYFSLSPINASIYFPNESNNIQNQDFCIVPNGVFPDVEVLLVPTNNAIPGIFNSHYNLLIHNKGTTIASGNVTLDFMGSNMNLVSANPLPSNQTANQLTWTYNNLHPLESRVINFYMHLSAPPVNNIGDSLHFKANFSLVNDIDTTDNTSILSQEIVGSFDPNDKTCLEGNHLLNSKIGDYLHYLIRFQNTGIYPADHVVVVDSINTNQFDLASIQILETSHNAHISVENNTLQFYFEDIQLADSFSNEPESHGYVLYKIRTKSNLPINSSVSNKAEIYFDYNLPVVTNSEVTTFANTVGLSSGLQSLPITCYPNPAQDVLNIETSEVVELVLYNSLGEKMLSKRAEGKDSMDVSKFSKGVYWIVGQGRGLAFVKE